MKTYINEFKKLPLFNGIKEEELQPMLTCIGGYIQEYTKSQFILLSKQPIKCVGIILEGTVHMIKEDVWGHKTVLAFMKKGELFGETFVCAERFTSEVTFYAATNCKVLYIPFYKTLHMCDTSCAFHHTLVENMVRLIANKNAQLMEKIEITSKKTLREKILTYLSIQAQLNQRNYFVIPLGRVELADYLCADRSALTRELNHMKNEGLIDFDKNTFQLLKKQ